MKPHVKWLLAICALLAVNILASVGLAVLAHRDASRVVPEYRGATP